MSELACADCFTTEEKTWFCQCDIWKPLCESCANWHTRNGHPLYTLAGIPVLICPAHIQPKLYVCDTCNVSICFCCVKETHIQHTWSYV